MEAAPVFLPARSVLSFHNEMAAAVSAQQRATRAQRLSQGFPAVALIMCGMNSFSWEHMMSTMLKKCPELGADEARRLAHSSDEEARGTTHIAELHHADLPQLADATVGRLRLQEQLSQRHFFASEELPHVAAGRESSPPAEPLQETNSLWSLICIRGDG